MAVTPRTVGEFDSDCQHGGTGRRWVRGMTGASAWRSLVATLACACGNPTAIIVQVTDGTGAGTAGNSGFDHLSFTIGAQDHYVDGGNATLYIRDLQSSSTVSVAGRDLTNDPYRLYIQSGLPDSGHDRDRGECLRDG